jgi:hypothetical protein
MKPLFFIAVIAFSGSFALIAQEERNPFNLVMDAALKQIRSGNKTVPEISLTTEEREQVLKELQKELNRRIAFCEQQTRSFLKQDYVSDPIVAKTYFTPEFAALWLEACNPPEGETIYWGADPILETQDSDPKMISFGPGEIDGDQIKVPVVFQHEGQLPYTKIFIFISHNRTWLISDILTTGLREGTESEFNNLRKNL